jgi:hypothetical protein
VSYKCEADSVLIGPRTWKALRSFPIWAHLCVEGVLFSELLKICINKLIHLFYLFANINKVACISKMNGCNRITDPYDWFLFRKCLYIDLTCVSFNPEWKLMKTIVGYSNWLNLLRVCFIVSKIIFWHVQKFIGYHCRKKLYKWMTEACVRKFE